MTQPTRFISKAASVVWDFPAFETVGDRMLAYPWKGTKGLCFINDYGTLIYAKAVYFDRMIRNIVY